MSPTIRAILIAVGLVITAPAVLLAVRLAAIEFGGPPRLSATFSCEDHPPHYVRAYHHLLDDVWEFSCEPQQTEERSE